VQDELLNNLSPVMDENPFLDTQQTTRQIVSVRMAMGISQKALAMEMGISPPYLNDLEKGYRRWTLAKFKNAKSALKRLSRIPGMCKKK